MAVFLKPNIARNPLVYSFFVVK